MMSHAMSLTYDELADKFSSVISLNVFSATEAMCVKVAGAAHVANAVAGDAGVHAARRCINRGAVAQV